MRAREYSFNYMGFIQSLALVATLFSSACSHTQSNSNTTGLVPFDQIESRGVTGVLGEPIGALVTIHGRTVTNGAGYDKGDSIFVRVSSVNDRPLSAPVSILLQQLDDGVNKTELPQENKDVDLTGFEAGGYSGIPPSDTTNNAQGHGYMFISTFVMLDQKRVPSTVPSPTTVTGEGNAIPIADFCSRKMSGQLGAPLGDLITIYGVAVNREHLGSGGWRILMNVNRVNDRMLTTPAVMLLCANWNAGWIDETGHHDTNPEMKEPAMGEPIVLIGYETGQFSGTPSAAFEYVPPWMMDGQHFETWFAVKSRKN